MRPKSRVTLEACTLDEAGTDWIEVEASVVREDEPDEKLRCQSIVLTRNEFYVLADRFDLYMEQHIWSTGSVERQ